MGRSADDVWPWVPSVPIPVLDRSDDVTVAPLTIMPRIPQRRRHSHRWLPLAVALLIPLVNPGSVQAAFDGPLMHLARPGPWPAVSELVIYDGRVWFANSQPYVDNNAADIYSYDPATTKLRFERGLFSQDVGSPAVVNGRLFLPFEDPRLNMSIGEYAVTDGRAWHWRRLPEGLAFHTHAIGQCGNDLLAVTGAWQGQLHVSPDDGRTWHLAADYPAREARFSRLIAIASWRDRCFIGASAHGRAGGKLLEWRDGDLMPVPDWPAGDRTDRLVTWRDRLLALNHTGNRSRLLAYDGRKVKPVAMPASGRLRDLAVDGDTLWAVVSNGSGGSLQRTIDGVSWEVLQRFDEAPVSVTALAGRVFVGTFSTRGGSLWGPSDTTELQRAAPAKPFEPPSLRPAPPALWAALDRAIDAYVEQRVGAEAGIDAVGRALRQLTTFDDPEIGDGLSARLATLDLDGRVWFFSRERVKRAHRLGWYLLGAMAVNGHGRIPPDVLGAPFSTRRNATKKNEDTPIAAISAVGWIGQDDRETIGALIDRLQRARGEPWLISDIVAALSALTGQRYGHDVERWRSWWMQESRR